MIAKHDVWGGACTKLAHVTRTISPRDQNNGNPQPLTALIPWLADSNNRVVQHVGYFGPRGSNCFVSEKHCPIVPLRIGTAICCFLSILNAWIVAEPARASVWPELQRILLWEYGYSVNCLWTFQILFGRLSLIRK